MTVNADPFLLICAALGVLLVGKVIEGNTRDRRTFFSVVLVIAVVALALLALFGGLVLST